MISLVLRELIYKLQCILIEIRNGRLVIRIGVIEIKEGHIPNKGTIVVEEWYSFV